MSLWDMSISGGIFIAVIIVIRRLLQRRLPRKVFQVLWVAAFLRLMLPFAIPCQFSIYSMAERCVMDFSENRISADGLPFTEEGLEKGTAVYEEEDVSEVSDEVVRMFLYPAGAMLCMLYYVFSYMKWHREFQTSLPVQDVAVQAWADNLPIRRKVLVRQWDLAVTPLAYGVVRPVILLPKALVQKDSGQLKFVLLHEYMHIRHFDAVKKMLLALVCCVHWFNPLVWAMCVLANRDMELDCDKHVIQYLGGDMRSAYALALIDMEEQRSLKVSWGNSFCKNAMEERVAAIMKDKKKTILAGVLSGVLTAGVIMVFATSAFALGRAEKTVYVQEGDTVSEEAYASGSPEDIGIEFKAQERTINENKTYSGEAYTGEVTVAAEDTAYTADSADSAEEQTVNEAHAEEVAVMDMAYEGDIEIPLPAEYVSYGITADPHTASWKYQGKQVAVFYDEGVKLYTYSVPGKKGAYLQVCRDKRGKITDIKDVGKKEMQEILKDTGLVLD